MCDRDAVRTGRLEACPTGAADWRLPMSSKRYSNCCPATGPPPPLPAQFDFHLLHLPRGADAHQLRVMPPRFVVRVHGPNARRNPPPAQPKPWLGGAERERSAVRRAAEGYQSRPARPQSATKSSQPASLSKPSSPNFHPDIAVNIPVHPFFCEIGWCWPAATGARGACSKKHASRREGTRPASFSETPAACRPGALTARVFKPASKFPRNSP